MVKEALRRTVLDWWRMGSLLGLKSRRAKPVPRRLGSMPRMMPSKGFLLREKVDSAED